MNSELANAPASSGIQPYSGETVRLLDTRSADGVADYQGGKNIRMWAATISAGYKEGQTPRVVQDGKIRLHEDMGEAPGIRAALESTDYKRLTISMMSDDINECLKQLFCAYGSIKVFGDEKALTVMKMEGGKQNRRTIYAGDPDYAKMLESCKVSTFVPFALAGWDANTNPAIAFPDGFVPYRLRFGSTNSATAFVEALISIKRLTGGRLVGIPLDLSIAYKTVMTPDLTRRAVPVWHPVLRHPKGLPFTTGDIRRVLSAGIADAAQLSLPQRIEMAPEVMQALVESDEKIDAETGEVADTGLMSSDIAEAIRTLTTGEVPQRRVTDFFKAMQGTPYVKDEYRPKLIEKMAQGALLQLSEPSLKELAEKATAEEWALCEIVMCKAAAAYHGTEETKAPKPIVSEDPYAQAIADAPPIPTDPTPTPSQEPTQEPPVESVTATVVEDPKPEEPALPPVNCYLALDRTITSQECAVAKAYARLHMDNNMFTELATKSGGIHPLFVILEARRLGVTNAGDIIRLVDEDFKETVEVTDETGQARLI